MGHLLQRRHFGVVINPHSRADLEWPGLDFGRVPSHLRHFTILNSVRAPRLQSLTLTLAAPPPWSACFNSGQTRGFLAGLPRLQSLTQQDLADDSFLSLLAESADQLARLDVQGSLGVTDRGLLCLAAPCNTLSQYPHH